MIRDIGKLIRDLFSGKLNFLQKRVSLHFYLEYLTRNLDFII